jgi:hypothetical protein
LIDVEIEAGTEHVDVQKLNALADEIKQYAAKTETGLNLMRAEDPNREQRAELVSNLNRWESTIRQSTKIR